MTRAADHYSVGAGEIKYLARFLHAVDVAVGKNRNCHARLDLANRVELRDTSKKIRARATVYGQGADAALLGDARDAYAVPARAVPAGANLEGDRRGDRAHHGIQNARHESLIGEQ